MLKDMVTNFLVAEEIVQKISGLIPPHLLVGADKVCWTHGEIYQLKMPMEN